MKNLLDKLKKAEIDQYVIKKKNDQIIIRWHHNQYGVSIVLPDEFKNSIKESKYSICPIKVQTDFSLKFSNELNLPYGIYEMYMNQSFEDIVNVFELMKDIKD